MTFEKQGPHNTEAALKLAIEAAREEGIHKIVVASSTGATAKKLAELEHEGIQIIDVGYARGVFGKHEPQMSDEMRQDLEAMGVIRPAPTAEFLDSKVDRIICMPRQG